MWSCGVKWSGVVQSISASQGVVTTRALKANRPAESGMEVATGMDSAGL